MNDNIKNCPCCGTPAMTEIIEPHGHEVATFMPRKNDWSAIVSCPECGLALMADADSEAEANRKAMEMWNRRVK